MPVPMTMPTPKPIRSSGPRRRLRRRAARAAAVPVSSSPPWARTSSTGLVRSIECSLMGRRYRRSAVADLPGARSVHGGRRVKGWAHDTALRVVRRPERRRPAALLGRRGVDQPRRAEEVPHGGAVPASGRPHEVASPAPYGGQGQQGEQTAASSAQRQTGSSGPVAPQWQGVQLGRPQPTTPDGGRPLGLVAPRRGPGRRRHHLRR